MASELLHLPCHTSSALWAGVAPAVLSPPHIPAAHLLNCHRSLSTFLTFLLLCPTLRFFLKVSGGYLFTFFIRRLVLNWHCHKFGKGEHVWQVTSLWQWNKWCISIFKSWRSRRKNMVHLTSALWLDFPIMLRQRAEGFSEELGSLVIPPVVPLLGQGGSRGSARHCPPSSRARHREGPE